MQGKNFEGNELILCWLGMDRHSGLYRNEHILSSTAVIVEKKPALGPSNRTPCTRKQGQTLHSSEAIGKKGENCIQTYIDIQKHQ